jgi:hypothetical protein
MSKRQRQDDDDDDDILGAFRVRGERRGRVIAIRCSYIRLIHIFQQDANRGRFSYSGNLMDMLRQQAQDEVQLNVSLKLERGRPESLKWLMTVSLACMPMSQQGHQPDLDASDTLASPGADWAPSPYQSVSARSGEDIKRCCDHRADDVLACYC